MKAAVWNDKGSLDVVERPAPEPKPGWVRLRVAAAGICGTDLHFYRGSFPSPKGLLPGHEIGGVVDRAGDGVELAAGLAVAAEPLVSCGVCYHCQSGDYNRCAKRMLIGVQGRGGCADFVTVPATCVYPLPDGVSPAAGALAEPLAVCVRGTRRGRIESGARVVIIGAGTIGLMSILTARAAGASTIFILARHPHQTAAARALGADGVFDSIDAVRQQLGETPVDCVIETVGGRAATLSDAVLLVRPGGVVSMLGVFEGPATIPALDFSTKEITLVGSNCYGRHGARTDFAIALELLHNHASTLTALVTHRFPLDKINEAFSAAADKHSGSIKVHIVPA
ncbi:MAG TPA: alcohol dehydrogenase catalytic domain-containing protein [Candidatus Binataceae bacterium]|nr:alcohol dehydrogenase catalytic domain-containing protein [Candidatus Binataceae bacterium]